MIVPICTAVMREVFSQAPAGEKEGALALGGTKWGVIRTVVLPFGAGGMIGGAMLGLGRALGETIAVTLIISPLFDPHSLPHVLQTGGNSIASLIALAVLRVERLRHQRADGGRAHAVRDHADRERDRLDHRRPLPLRRGDGDLTPMTTTTELEPIAPDDVERRAERSTRTYAGEQPAIAFDRGRSDRPTSPTSSARRPVRSA